LLRALTKNLTLFNAFNAFNVFNGLVPTYAKYSSDSSGMNFKFWRYTLFISFCEQKQSVRFITPIEEGRASKLYISFYFCDFSGVYSPLCTRSPTQPPTEEGCAVTQKELFERYWSCLTPHPFPLWEGGGENVFTMDSTHPKSCRNWSRYKALLLYLPLWLHRNRGSRSLTTSDSVFRQRLKSLYLQKENGISVGKNLCFDRIKLLSASLLTHPSCGRTLNFAIPIGPHRVADQ